jgi:hypothetical protein
VWSFIWEIHALKNNLQICSVNLFKWSIGLLWSRLSNIHKGQNEIKYKLIEPKSAGFLASTIWYLSCLSSVTTLNKFTITAF